MWHRVVLTVNELEAVVIEWISHLMFEMGAQGTEVNAAHDYLEDKENLFGEIPLELSQELLEQHTEIIGYFEGEVDSETLNQQFEKALRETKFDLKVEPVVEENWQSNWMVHYKVERVSRFVTIVPQWEDYQPAIDEKVVYLDPGLAFGTGNHPTPQLGIQALEMNMRGGERVLDIGTGSGILAFVARELGASQVWGYDLDPQAVESANLNLQYQKGNITTPIEFAVNDLLKGVEHQAEIIVANILPHILVNMLDDASKLLVEGGHLILGGILKEKGPEIEAALSEFGWTIIQKNNLHEWLGYVAQKEREA